ncbi:MAG: hypothetical protein ACK2T3_01475, partial [Candidatus Promineifilaceae bacterium]
RGYGEEGGSPGDAGRAGAGGRGVGDQGSGADGLAEGECDRAGDAERGGALWRNPSLHLQKEYLFARIGRDLSTPDRNTGPPVEMT